MNLNTENVLVGPEFKNPTSLVSFGKQIYDSMLNTSSDDIIFINASSGKEITYAHFFNLSCRLARSLQNCGYKTNDIISICSENNEYYFVPVAASFFLGIISAPLNHMYTKSEILHLTEITRPKIIFCTEKMLHVFIELKEQSLYIEKIIILDVEESLDGHQSMIEFINQHCDKDFSPSKLDLVEVDPLDQLAVIMSSSGTTGLPKGVMITHDNISINAQQTFEASFFGVKNKILYTLPFFHAFGFLVVLSGIIRSITFVIMPRYKEDLLLNSIEKYKISAVYVVPPIVHFLALSPSPLGYDLSSLETIFVGGAPLGEDVEIAINKRFPTASIRQGYGMTEGTCVVLVMPVGQKRGGSIGKLVSATSAYVRDIETDKALGPNQTGELCFKGRQIVKGYYRNPEATKSTIIDGWLRSGDLGYYDAEGYFFVIDRVKELIKYKGFQVPPAELEGILLTHPKVKDVGVVGKPDDVAGELPTAFIVKNPDCELDEKEIIKFVADQVSKHKQLHGGVKFVDVIPKTGSGKVLRRVLRKALMTETSTE